MKIRSFWNVDIEKMERISWMDKVTNEDVLRKVNEEKQILYALW